MKKTIVKLKNACLTLPKNRGKNVLALLFLVLQGLLSTFTFAQTKTLQGHIVNEKGEAVQGATIRYKSVGSKGTITDANGNFTLNLPTAKSTLVISYVGYNDKEVVVSPQSTSLAISLVPTANNQLDQVVVVGYGTQRKKDVTGSIVSVGEQALREVPVSNLQGALQGRAAGLEVQKVGTRPGAGAVIRIRGERTINGSNDPLIILDGIPFEGGNINDINPDDVASIDILKDASATAIYGSRGYSYYYKKRQAWRS